MLIIEIEASNFGGVQSAPRRTLSYRSLDDEGDEIRAASDGDGDVDGTMAGVANKDIYCCSSHCPERWCISSVTESL